MADLEKLYKSIATVKDKSTRNILYIQFIWKYFPESFELLTGYSEYRDFMRGKK